MNNSFENVFLNNEEFPICENLEDSDKNGTLYTYSSKSLKEFQKELKGVFSFVYYVAEKFKQQSIHHIQKDPIEYSISNFTQTSWYKGLKVYLDFVHNPKETLEKGKIECQKFLDYILNNKGNSNSKLTEDNKKEIEDAKNYPPLAEDDAERFEKWGVIIYTDIFTQGVLRSVFPIEKYPRLIIATVVWPYYTTNNNICESTIMRCMRYQAIELFKEQTICIRDADTIFVRGLNLNYEKYPDYITYMIMWWESEFLKPWITEYDGPNYHGYNSNSEKAKMTIKLNKEDRTKMYYDIIIGTNRDYSSDWHKNLPGKYPLSNQVSLSYYDKVKLDKVQNNESTKTIFRPFRGLFAGFVNITKNKDEHVLKIWLDCVNFLLKRYFIGVNSQGQRVISDEYCRDITGYSIGKDERLLIFVFPLDDYRKYKIHYYYIEYSTMRSENEKVVNAKSWPLTINYNSLFFDHLLTPYYNSGVYKTVYKTMNDYLGELQDKTINDYKQFLEKVNIEKGLPAITKKIEECNLHLTKETMFLKEAKIISPNNIDIGYNLAKSVPSARAIENSRNHTYNYYHKNFPAKLLVGGKTKKHKKIRRSKKRLTYKR